MEENGEKVLYGWSWEENKEFEVALAVVDEENPERWELVAAMVGGNKSAQDVQNHYYILVKDLQCIESGELDHTLFHPFWTDEQHTKLQNLVQLDIS